MDIFDFIDECSDHLKKINADGNFAIRYAHKKHIVSKIEGRNEIFGNTTKFKFILIANTWDEPFTNVFILKQLNKLKAKFEAFQEKNPDALSEMYVNVMGYEKVIKNIITNNGNIFLQI